MKKRVIAYIDGFNLFYSSLKGTKNKWLDLWSMCSSLLKEDQELIEIKYFTARVKTFTDETRRLNQNTYLSALLDNPKIKITFGFFTLHNIKLPLTKPMREENRLELAEVLKTEEKGSDVNLAVSLLSDAYQNKFDYAMLFSNDSDMAMSVEIAKNICNKKVGLYIDKKANTFDVLKKNTTVVFKLEKSFFARHQFPDSIKLSTGKIITKPASW